MTLKHKVHWTEPICEVTKLGIPWGKRELRSIRGHERNTTEFWTSWVWDDFPLPGLTFARVQNKRSSSHFIGTKIPYKVLLTPWLTTASFTHPPSCSVSSLSFRLPFSAATETHWQAACLLRFVFTTQTKSRAARVFPVLLQCAAQADCHLA